MSHENDILGTMPPSMRLEFSSQLYTKYLQNVPMFRGLPEPLIHSISLVVVPMLAVKDQEIYSEGSSGKEMYILLEGELEVTSKGERLGFLGDGAVSPAAMQETICDSLACNCADVDVGHDAVFWRNANLGVQCFGGSTAADHHSDGRQQDVLHAQGQNACNREEISRASSAVKALLSCY